MSPGPHKVNPRQMPPWASHGSSMKRRDDKNPFSWAESQSTQGRDMLRGSQGPSGKPGASLLRLSPPSHRLLLNFLRTLHCHLTPVPETFNGPYCTYGGSRQRACTVGTEGLLSLTRLQASLPQPCEACWKQILRWDQNCPAKLYHVSVPRETFT